ncbi:hypothetical protein DdX_00180 [Ditylenchus destructor]|uniref:Uncharacterized protein n=1 Tax=Ditylenchus destructor TaxID=166010 RepID=A0AAD4RD38_9BILA|nr:hypothetical protein DdX_00180 [Ditylenchus destructor]
MNIHITILLTIFNAYLIEGPKRLTNGQKVHRSAIKFGNTIPDPKVQPAVQLMAHAYKIAPKGFTNYGRALLKVDKKKLAAELVKEGAAHALAFGAVGMGADADEAYVAARGVTHNAANVVTKVEIENEHETMRPQKQTSPKNEKRRTSTWRTVGYC